jgi:hypothetical protein
MKKFLRTNNPYIGFNDVPFILIGTPIVSIMVTMIFFGISVKEALLCTAINIVPAAISTAVFWLGDRYIILYFRKKFPAFHDVKKRLFYQSVVVLTYTAVDGSSIEAYRWFLYSLFFRRDCPSKLFEVICCLHVCYGRNHRNI